MREVVRTTCPTPIVHSIPCSLVFWSCLLQKSQTDEPPKKTKADRVKIDGGVAERAALAGWAEKYLRVAEAHQAKLQPGN